MTISDNRQVPHSNEMVVESFTNFDVGELNVFRIHFYPVTFDKHVSTKKNKIFCCLCFHISCVDMDCK